MSYLDFVENYVKEINLNKVKKQYGGAGGSQRMFNQARSLGKFRQFMGWSVSQMCREYNEIGPHKLVHSRYSRYETDEIGSIKLVKSVHTFISKAKQFVKLAAKYNYKLTVDQLFIERYNVDLDSIDS